MGRRRGLGLQAVGGQARRLAFQRRRQATLARSRGGTCRLSYRFQVLGHGREMFQNQVVDNGADPVAARSGGFDAKLERGFGRHSDLDFLPICMSRLFRHGRIVNDMRSPEFWFDCVLAFAVGGALVIMFLPSYLRRRWRKADAKLVGELEARRLKREDIVMGRGPFG